MEESRICSFESLEFVKSAYLIMNFMLFSPTLMIATLPGFNVVLTVAAPFWLTAVPT
jgi:hypothetical protein